MIWIRWDKKTDRLRNGLRDWIMLKTFQQIQYRPHRRIMSIAPTEEFYKYMVKMGNLYVCS